MASTSLVVTLYLLCALIASALMVYVQKKDNGQLKKGELILLMFLGFIWPVTAFTFICEQLASWFDKP